jgi:hypothetical protein
MGFATDAGTRMTEFDKIDEENRATYAVFLNLLKWSLVLIAIVLIGLAIFTI